MADNTTLMRVRQLEVLEKIAANSKLTMVLGDKGLTDRLFGIPEARHSAYLWAGCSVSGARFHLYSMPLAAQVILIERIGTHVMC